MLKIFVVGINLLAVIHLQILVISELSWWCKSSMFEAPASMQVASANRHNLLNVKEKEKGTKSWSLRDSYVNKFIRGVGDIN